MENLHRTGRMSSPEYAVLCQWYDYIVKNKSVTPDLFVYLRTTPCVVAERVKRRDRSEERSVDLSYLENLHNLHESWVNTNVLYTSIPVI